LRWEVDKEATATMAVPPGRHWRPKKKKLNAEDTTMGAEDKRTRFFALAITQRGKKLQKTLSRGTGENRAETGRNAAVGGKKN
jgi:hypothetical protein